MGRKKKRDISSDIFIFTETTMDKLDIPFIEEIDDRKEFWKYLKIDEKTVIPRYLISSYGRIYNIETKSICNQVKSYKSSKGNYRSVYIGYGRASDVDKKTYSNGSYFVHRLMAYTFIPLVEGKPIVNHIDGVPYHNYMWNLEWCTLSENYIHALRTGLKKEPRGEQRSNALWTDDEIRLICSMMEDGHKSTFIYKALLDIIHDPKVTYERVHTLYKHIVHRTHWAHISKDYDIDFSSKNYLKEKASVSKRQANKENSIPELLKPL